MIGPRLTRLAALLLLALVTVASGRAAIADDFASCDRSAVDPDVGIPACTRLLDRAAEEGVNVPAVYNNRGNAWVRKGLYSSAIEDFNAAIQRDPKFVDAYRNRGIAWHRSGDYDRAIADLNQALRLDPRSATTYNARGLALMNKGEFDRAIADFDAAIKLDPRYAAAFNNRGLAFHSKRDLDRAIADFNRVIKLAPNAIDGLNNRALVWMDKGNLDAAIADFNATIRLQPNNWRGYSSRGESYRLKGELAWALKDHNEAIQLDPNQADAYNNRGVLLRDMGDFDGATADYDEAILLNPRYERAYTNRGQIWRLRGKIENSLADLNKALSLNPESPIALAYRGETLRKKGELDRAIADFNGAIRVLPDMALAFVGRGLAYQDKGDDAHAVADFEKSLRFSPDFDADLTRQAQSVAREQLAFIQVAAAAKQRKQEEEARRQEGEAQRKEAEARQRAEDEARQVALAEEARKRSREIAAITPDPGRRVALVIGNSNYRNVAGLPNAASDADVVGAALKKVGFQSVVIEKDLSRDKMVAVMRAFEDQVETADWAVVYYAGHGIEISGVNYLIPIDARLHADRDVQDEAVPLDRVLAATERAKKLRLVVLDACRDNPFVPQMRRVMASRSIGRGLARIEPEGGTMVVYAAKDGQVAMDGDRDNSPFVESLVRHLETPNVEISKLFRLVRDDVLAVTNRQQEPFVYGSLPGDDFFFLAK